MKEVLRPPEPPSVPEVVSFPARPSPSRDETPVSFPARIFNEDELFSFPAKPEPTREPKLEPTREPKLEPRREAKPEPRPIMNEDKTPSSPLKSNPKPNPNPRKMAKAKPTQRGNQSKAKKPAVHAKEEAKEEIAKEEDELNELINSLHSSMSVQESEGPETEMQNVWDQKIKKFQELQRRKQKALREVGKAGEESVVGRGEGVGRRNN